jgi:peptidoglycan-N-acetylglucosamine deacetylase
MCLLTLAGCTASGAPLHNVARAVGAPTPAPSASASPQASPSPSPSPSDKPKPPPPPPVNPISCTDSAALDRAQAMGSGPLGTVKTTGSAAVALTFDDGPDAVTTPKILDLLAQCGVKATFCVNGIKVGPNPELIRRMVREGHTLCNHTWRHIRQLGTYGKDLIRQDLQQTNDAIHAIVPDARVPYFRAPGGAWTPDYLTVAHELGMTSLHWDVDPSDWDYANYGRGDSMVNHIISNVEGNVRPGSVVLSHDFQKPETVTAYRILLPWLKARLQLIALPQEGLG